jgi:hypothetical protein
MFSWVFQGLLLGGSTAQPVNGGGTTPARPLVPAAPGPSPDLTCSSSHASSAGLLAGSGPQSICLQITAQSKGRVQSYIPYHVLRLSEDLKLHLDGGPWHLFLSLHKHRDFITPLVLY